MIRTQPGLSVLATTALLIADNVGTGVLALPGQIANIGRVWGMLLLVVMVVPNVFAGMLLHRAASMVEARREHSGTDRVALLRTDRVRDYATLAVALNGHAGVVTKATCFFYYLSIFLQMGNYLIVLSQTLQAALVGAWPLCRP